MNVTEVTIELLRDRDGNVICHGNLCAYVNFVLEGCFAVHGCKIIQGTNRLTVAMPQRRVNVLCSQCQRTTYIMDDFCGRCGAQMPEFWVRTQPLRNGDGRIDMHRDVCHPLDRETRMVIERAILDKYAEATCQTPTE